MKDLGRFAAILGGLAVLVACGGGSSGTITDPGIPAVDVIQSETTTETGADVPLTGDKILSFVQATGDDGKSCQDGSTCAVILSYNTDRDLEVFYKQGGQPKPDAALTFEILDDPDALCQLSSAMAYTGADGKAAVKIQSKKEKNGTLQVKVCASGEAAVECLYFNVIVTPKGFAHLMVGFEDYNGVYKADLTNAEVRIFLQGANGKPKCPELPLDGLPAATVVSPKLASLTATAVFPDLPNLETDGVQNYSILGFAMDDAGTVKAYACEDAKGMIEYGSMTSVTLKLVDVPPRIKGTYELTSTFDMVSGLPKEVGDVVYTITGFFTNPAAEVLKLICNAGAGNQTMTDFCGFVFTNPADPDPKALTATGEVVLDIVNKVLLAILDANCPFDDKTQCSKIYWTGEDIANILTKFQLLSTLEFTCEPGSDGTFAAGCVTEKWTDARLRWTLGMDCPGTDENCGWKKFGFSQVEGMSSTISAQPEVKLIDQKLLITRHALDLKYGALLNFAIEKWLLPSLLGDGSDGLPVVDTYEAMVGSLLAGKACLADGTCCEVFAQNVSKQASGVTESLVKGACEALITVGSKYLRDKMTGLAASPDAFKIGTKGGCQLYDKNQDMKFDAVGQKDAQCDWDATLTVGATESALTATFWGLVK